MRDVGNKVLDDYGIKTKMRKYVVPPLPGAPMRNIEYFQDGFPYSPFQFSQSPTPPCSSTTICFSFQNHLLPYTQRPWFEPERSKLVCRRWSGYQDPWGWSLGRNPTMLNPAVRGSHFRFLILGCSGHFTDTNFSSAVRSALFVPDADRSFCFQCPPCWWEHSNYIFLSSRCVNVARSVYLFQGILYSTAAYPR